jgi:hypothetical protein
LNPRESFVQRSAAQDAVMGRNLNGLESPWARPGLRIPGSDPAPHQEKAVDVKDHGGNLTSLGGVREENAMKARPEEVKCPAEIYGADLVAEIMTRVYPSQVACAESHGCERDVCLLEGRWPEETGEREEEPDDAPFRRVSAPGSSSGSGWEFLGSD